MIFLFKKKTTIILLYILTYLFIYYVCLGFNISYLFYENYNMKNTFINRSLYLLGVYFCLFIFTYLINLYILN